ncbi:Scarecrow-like protein 28 [Bienertia sinuspersici]
MLAGCSSTLVSPRHRLRSEASAQFQACHYPLPSMSTQRLDLPCNFPRKEVSVSRSTSIRTPVSLSVEKPIESKGLKQTIKAEFWGDKGKNLKRRQHSFDDDDDEEQQHSFVKRKKSRYDFGESQGEEERVCFAPTDVVSPPLLPPLSHNPWVDSEITEYGDEKEGGGPSHGPFTTTTTSGSSSSSESHSLGFRLHDSISDQFGNGSMNRPNPGNGHGSRAVLTHNDDFQTEQQGFELVSFLVSCVEAITSRNIPAINHFVAKLGEQASPRGRSTISRLTAYFIEALA